MPRQGPPSGHLFNRPIPGQSLTKAPGSSPWHKPPKFAKLNDACNYVFNQLTQPPKLRVLLEFMKQGVPLEPLARLLIFTGFSQGLWTPDVGMLMAPPVMYMLAGIAERAKMHPKLTHIDRSGFQDLVGIKHVANMSTSNPMGQPEQPITKPTQPMPSVKGLLSPPGA